MGDAADRKLNEIDATRKQLEADLNALESRLPTPARSAKSMLGLAVGGTTLLLMILGRLRSKGSKRAPAAEIVVRIVRDDV